MPIRRSTTMAVFMTIAIALSHGGCQAPNDSASVPAVADGSSDVTAESSAADSGHSIDTTMTPKATTLAVMTFNIRNSGANDGKHAWPHRRDLVARVVRDSKCDVVGMQEVLADQFDALVSDLPEFEFFGVGRLDGIRRGEFSPIAWRRDRFTRVDGGTFWLSDTPDIAGSNTWGAACERICTWAMLTENDGDRRLMVMNTHFDHESSAARYKSAEMLAQRVSDAPSTVTLVLIGDFNAATNTQDLAPLLRPDYSAPTGALGGAAGLLVDSWNVVHGRSQDTQLRTHHAFKGGIDGRKIDHILVRPGVGVTAAEVHRDRFGELYPSDHYPVSAVIQLQ